MALYLNESRRNTSTGKIERTGRLEAVGRSKRSSGGGYQQSVVGTIDRNTGEVVVTDPTSVSNEKGALIEARIAEEKTMSKMSSEVDNSTSSTGPVAVASTVAGTSSGVVRQETTTGGFSTVYNGGAGSGVASYTFQKQVPTTQKTITQNNKQKGYLDFTGGTVQPAKGSVKPNVFTGFLSGLKTDVVGNVFAGKTSGPSKPVQYFTPTELSTAAGRTVRGFGESSLSVLSISPAIRGAGAVTKAAQSTRIGGISGIRQSLPIAVPIAGAIGVSVGARKAETRSITGNSVFDVSGVDVRNAIDTGSARYSDESGFFRSIGQSTFFPVLADRTRYERTVSDELVSRGVSASRAREIASQSFSNRAAIRGRSDVAVGVLGEVSGEAGGRLANVFLDARAARNAPIVGSTSFAARRGISSAFGGVIEGGTQAAASDIQGSGRVSARNVGFGSLFGGVTAGSAGFVLADLRVKNVRGSSRVANVIEGGLDVLDPLERPGDVTFDAFEGRGRGFFGRPTSITSGRVGNRVFVRTAPFSGSFGSSVRSSGLSSTRSNSEPIVTRAFTVSSSSRPNARSSSSIANSFGLSSTNSLVSIPSRSSNRIANRSFSLSNVYSRSNVPTRANSNARPLVPTLTNSFTPSKTPTRTATRVFTPEIPLLPFAGGSGGGLFGRGGGSKRTSSLFAPSFTALALNIRGRGKRSSSGFGGFEVRGL